VEKIHPIKTHDNGLNDWKKVIGCPDWGFSRKTKDFNDDLSIKKERKIGRDSRI